jgi:hypothetical protein
MSTTITALGHLAAVAKSQIISPKDTRENQVTDLVEIAMIIPMMNIYTTTEETGKLLDLAQEEWSPRAQDGGLTPHQEGGLTLHQEEAREILITMTTLEQRKCLARKMHLAKEGGTTRSVSPGRRLLLHRPHPGPDDEAENGNRMERIHTPWMITSVKSCMEMTLIMVGEAQNQIMVGEVHQNQIMTGGVPSREGKVLIQIMVMLADVILNQSTPDELKHRVVQDLTETNEWELWQTS